MKGKMLSALALMTVFVGGFSYAAGMGGGQGSGGQGMGGQGNLSQFKNQTTNQMRNRLSYQDMDQNTDGQVTKEEYEAAIAQRRDNAPGMGANQNTNMFTFEELDLNGDALLSQEEFNQHLATTSRRLKQ